MKVDLIGVAVQNESTGEWIESLDERFDRGRIRLQERVVENKHEFLIFEGLSVLGVHALDFLVNLLVDYFEGDLIDELVERLVLFGSFPQLVLHYLVQTRGQQQALCMKMELLRETQCDSMLLELQQLFV